MDHFPSKGVLLNFLDENFMQFLVSLDAQRYEPGTAGEGDYLLQSGRFDFQGERFQPVSEKMGRGYPLTP
jgi:hypothetical protein